MARTMAKNVKRTAEKRGEAKRIKPPVILDDIIFHMSQLRVGDTLVCYGRWQPLSRWQILKFDSHYVGKIEGEIKVRKVNELRRLHDVVTVRNVATQEIKKMTFAYMSYSAIWRLETKGANDEG